MDISIVVPLYNEEANVLPLYESIKRVMVASKTQYEIIFVDDGSADGTSKTIEAIAEKDKLVKVIQFQKNLGKTAALSVGFKHAKGNIIITMDGDLQNDPKDIPKFIDKINANYDLVVGWRSHRKDPFTKRFPSKIFNYLTKILTGINIHDFNCGFKAYRKRVTEDIILYGDLHRYIPVIAHWEDFSVGEVEVEHHPRIHGKSKYGFSRLFGGFLDLFTVKFLISYSKRPLHLFGSLGLISIMAGLVIGVILVYVNLVYGVIIVRPMLFLVVLLIIAGIQLVALGLLGEMIVSIKKKEEKDNQLTLRGGEL